MSEKKKHKVIHVDNLVIHAENVDFIRERPRRERDGHHEKDPWGFLWGRPRVRHGHGHEHEHGHGHGHGHEHEHDHEHGEKMED